MPQNNCVAAKEFENERRRRLSFERDREKRKGRELCTAVSRFTILTFTLCACIARTRTHVFQFEKDANASARTKCIRAGWVPLVPILPPYYRSTLCQSHFFEIYLHITKIFVGFSSDCVCLCVLYNIVGQASAYVIYLARDFVRLETSAFQLEHI